MFSRMDREAWRAAIHGVAKSWTRLSDQSELNPVLKGIKQCKKFSVSSYRQLELIGPLKPERWRWGKIIKYHHPNHSCV